MNDAMIQTFNDPREIYQIVNERVDEIIGTIEKNNQENKYLNEIKQSKASLYGQQQAIKNGIRDLEKNSEWNELTIAFYGETNAGKSTIIETLRILFKEDKKIQNQIKFNKLQEKIDILYNQKSKLVTEIHQYEENKVKVIAKKNGKKEIFNTLDSQEQDEILMINSNFEDKNKNNQFIFEQKWNELKILENQSLENKSFLYKFLFFLTPSETKIIRYQLKQLDDKNKTEKYNLNQELMAASKNIEKKYNQLKNSLQIEIDELGNNLNSLNNLLSVNLSKLNEINENIKLEIPLMKPFQDGEIIGDGRSDFTRESTSFNFKVNGINVKVIDVPGIEGDEKKVEHEINKAVLKAHVIFYVTAKDAPPQEGTLTKIKCQLNSQTEVYCIYNKPATHPRVIDKKGLINEDEEKSLREIDSKIINSIGNDNYKGHLIISGLAAFYSQAFCFIPESDHAKKRKLFLGRLNADLLIEKSGLSSFQSVLLNNVITPDYRKKIRINNLNKIQMVINKVYEVLNVIRNDFEKLSVQMNNNAKEANANLDRVLNNTKTQLNNDVEKLIDEFGYSARDKIYSKIDQNISNDDFKYYLEHCIRDHAQELPEKLQDVFDIDMQNFIDESNKIITKLEQNLQSLVDGYKNQLEHKGLTFDFSEMKSGVNTVGLMGVGLGTAAALWWNPVGWVAITAVVAGLVIQFLKSIWGAFSSDYKMSQQREISNKNIRSAKDNIREKAKTELNNVNTKLVKSIDDLKNNFAIPRKNIEITIKKINKSNIELLSLSKEINNAKGI